MPSLNSKTLKRKLENWKPYIYIVCYKPTNQYYIGSRYAVGCNPEDFLSKYFTSSERIKHIARENPQDFEYKILKQYNPEDILNKIMFLEIKSLQYRETHDIIGLWSKENISIVQQHIRRVESKYLRRLRVKESEMWLNILDGTEGKKFYQHMHYLQGRSQKSKRI